MSRQIRGTDWRWGAFLGVALGCSGPTHPQFVETTTDQGGRVGRPAVDTGATQNGGSGAVAGGGAGGETTSEPVNIPVPGGGLDPDQVYLIGTLQTALAGVDVVAAHNDSTHYTAGFPSSAYAVGPRFWDGRLVYKADDVFRVYTPDYQGSASYADDKYPQNTELNDPVLETPPCLVASGAVAGAGRLFYRCEGEGWFESGEKVAEQQLNIRAIGYENLVFLDNDDGVHSLATGESHALPTEFFNGAVWTIRPSKKGFYYVTESQLLEIDADGNVEVMGTYADAPAGYQYHYAVGSMQIAGDLALIQHARIRESSTDVIIRRELDGEAKVVFSNDDGGPVFYWASYLFTGP